MQEYTLKRISRQQKTSKAGKSYESVGIQVAEFGEAWINGFGNKENANWKEGDKIKVKIFDDTYNGKTSKKFEMIKKEDVIAKGNEEILGKLATISLGVQELLEWKRIQTGEVKPKVPYPTKESEGLTEDERF